jgi:ABC-type multidrug transport system fused ATPase/permease subunit
MVTLLRDGTTALALLVYLFWENWLLTLMSLVTVPVLAVGVRLVQRRVLAVGRAGYDAQLSLAAVAEDMARAWRVIRSFGAEGFERERFDQQARRLQSLTLKTAAANALMTPVSQAAALQDDLRRAHIEPYAWLLNKSVLAAGTHDPLLAARLAGERRQIARLQGGLAKRLFALPWLATPPVGVAELSRLARA